MDRTAATAHSGHDELLIARMFGGDVTELERDRALDLLSECGECAALFADLDAIEEAGVEMAIPTRPREFTLTPQDAARLRARRRLPLFADWAGMRRAFGSSMAALGLFGFVASSYLSGSGAANGAFSPVQRDEAQPAAVAATAAAPNAGYAYATPAASGATGTRAPVGPNPDSVPGSSEDPSARPVASSAPGTPRTEIALASPGGKSAPSTPPNLATGQTGSCAQSSSTTCTSDLTNGEGVTPPSAPSSGGPDAGLVRLAGFGGLFLAGLAVLIVPQLRRRRARGSSRS